MVTNYVKNYYSKYLNYQNEWLVIFDKNDIEEIL
jgi:hypothetical protein